MGLRAFHLVVRKEGQTLHEVPLEDAMTIGRDADNVISLPDRAISRKHLNLKSDSAGVRVTKLSRFAPVLVNGNEIEAGDLKPGDVIGIGPYLISIESDQHQEIPKQLELVPVENDVPSKTIDPAPELSVEESHPPEPNPEFEQNEMAPDPEPVPESENQFGDEDGKTRVFNLQSEIVAEISIAGGKANVSTIALEETPITLGRGSQCQVILSDKKASRQHLTLRREGNRYFAKDLESGNGTFLNGEKFDEIELLGGEVLKIGDTEIRFEVKDKNYFEKKDQFLVPDIEIPEAPSNLPQEVQNPVPDPALDFSGVPGMGADAGLSGVEKKQSLVEKFKALPPKKQALYAGFALLLAVTLYFGEEEEAPKKKSGSPQAKVSPSPGASGGVSFEQLTEEQKKFVVAQYTLGFDLYKNGEYDQSIFEIRKIYPIIPEYKDARMIERYAIEGKRVLESKEEERRKKEEEAKNKARIRQLIETIAPLMESKKYAEATALFPEVLALDPENQQVANWQREIDDLAQAKREEAERKLASVEKNKPGWETYENGLKLLKKQECRPAIKLFQEVEATGADDSKLLGLAKQKIKQCMGMIQAKFGPALTEAVELEKSGHLPEAYKKYDIASRIDPLRAEPHDGMDRIRGVIQEQAKILYTEAVLSENYSDFDLAKQKFEQVLNTVPEDNIYYQRAKNKLARYSYFKRAPASDPTKVNSGDPAQEGSPPDAPK